MTLNRITVRNAHDFVTLKNIMKSSETDFDFNNIRPMPDVLKDTEIRFLNEHIEAITYYLTKDCHGDLTRLKNRIQDEFPHVQWVERTRPLNNFVLYGRVPNHMSIDDLRFLLKHAENINSKEKPNSPDYDKYAAKATKALIETGTFDTFMWKRIYWGSDPYDVVFKHNAIEWWSDAPATPLIDTLYDKYHIPLFYAYCSDQFLFAEEHIYDDLRFSFTASTALGKLCVANSLGYADIDEYVVDKYGYIQHGQPNDTFHPIPEVYKTSEPLEAFLAGE